MSEDLHRLAERLLLESTLGSIPDSELSWLTVHLETCPRCAALAKATRRTIEALRSVPVNAPPGLVSITQVRVHERACELRRGSKTPVFAWLGVALSLGWVGVSGVFVWHGLEWAAVKTGIPGPLWRMGFGLWWFIPALVVAAMLITRRPGVIENTPVQGQRC